MFQTFKQFKTSPSPLPSPEAGEESGGETRQPKMFDDLNDWNGWNCLNGLLLVQPIDITARFQFFQKTHVGKIAWFCLSRLGILRFQLVEI